MQVKTNVPPDTAPPSHAVLPNSVPHLITHQALPKNRGYVIRRENILLEDSLTNLYQILYRPVKENFQNITDFLSYFADEAKKRALRGFLCVLRGQTAVERADCRFYERRMLLPRACG